MNSSPDQNIVVELVQGGSVTNNLNKPSRFDDARFPPSYHHSDYCNDPCNLDSAPCFLEITFWFLEESSCKNLKPRQSVLIRTSTTVSRERGTTVRKIRNSDKYWEFHESRAKSASNINRRGSRVANRPSVGNRPSIHHFILPYLLNQSRNCHTILDLGCQKK